MAERITVDWERCDHRDAEAARASRATLSRFPARATLRHVAGLAEFVTHLGAEITTVAHEVHQAWNPVARIAGDPIGRHVYGSVRLGFLAAQRVAAMGGRLGAGADGDEEEPDPAALLDVQCALNGAFGHLYEEVDSPFALPMRLLRADREVDPDARLVVFVHGLCHSERGWQNPEHGRFGEWLRGRFNARRAYVRYNSGLRISTNGARLAELLDREAPEREIVLVGHSMGGLVARSALHHGEADGHDWVRRVSRLACLGSPHKGTRLERLGNYANRQLGALPWTRPLMRLGNLRSDGIRDLRFGHLSEDDWSERDPDDPSPSYSSVGLASHVDHLHVAALHAERGGSHAIGDWLVPVRSALAHGLHPEDGVRRELLRGLHHLSLLADARVYDTLRRWLDDGG